MALKTLHCSLDCAASGFGSVARPYVHTIENCRLMLLPSRQRLSDCRQRPTEVRSTVRVNGLVGIGPRSRTCHLVCVRTCGSRSTHDDYAPADIHAWPIVLANKVETLAK